MMLTEWVGVMEEKMEEMHQGVKLSMETMKSEFQGQMATLMERFNWMADKWEEQERGRKGKEREGNKRTELPISSENSLGIKNGSREFEGGIGSEGGWRPDHRNRRLEMPIAEEEEVEDTLVCLEGEALAWFEWEKKRQEVTESGRIEGEDTGKISAITRRFSGGEILGTPAGRISSGLSEVVRDLGISVG
ncbi:Uncharacterized protein Adt_31463 [Abeliophyllum distichum]|uniref:Uncharacterized protein n=1 Tax=Abeliophyllum distichum TaxID=126358 RepID=A0ABD1RE59_9LAMI